MTHTVSAIEFTPINKLNNDNFTVCSITINSDDEIKTFYDQLNKGNNKGKFQFVELTKLGDRDNWFNNSCNEQLLMCDILLISGHFGGSFFGNKELTLSTDELESKICDQSCKRILNNPKEVFLFGCNTLAGKDADTRTMEEYIEILVRDNIPRTTAEHIASYRYSPLGDEFKQRMKKVFSEVPHLYGFKSIGPSGKSVKQYLDKYFLKKKDYSNYLNNETTLKVVDSLGQINYTENKDLFDALKVTNFTQCSGDLNNLLDNDVEKDLCYIRNNKIPIEERLAAIDRLATSEHLLHALPTIQYFFENNDPKNFSQTALIYYEKIKQNKEVQATVLNLIDKLPPLLSIKLLDLSDRLTWIDKISAQKRITNILKDIFRRDMDYATKDSLCSMAKTTPTLKEINYDFIKIEGGTKGAYKPDALGCLASATNEKVLKIYIEGLENPTDELARQNAALGLKELKPNNTLINKKLAKALRDKSVWVRQAAIWALMDIVPQEKDVQIEIVKSLDDTETIRERAKNALYEIKPIDPEVIRLLKKDHPNFKINWEY